jgi:orotate phosphoribosyltransferase
MIMSEQRVFNVFKKLNVIITDSHVVLASGRHASSYIDKDMVYPDTQETSKLCKLIAARFASASIEVVVSPEKGGIILSQWVAYHLSQMTSRKVLAFYAEKDGCGGFILKRGQAKERIPEKRVLVVEDILTTGGSVRKVIELVRTVNGNVIGLGVLCNRGRVTPEDVANPPELFSLINADFIEKRVDVETWIPGECKLCAEDVPINTDVGKGKEFLAQKEN